MKSRCCEEVSEKYPVSKHTARRWVKEYQSTEIFSKSKRGIHPKRIWALQDEGVREIFISTGRKLQNQDLETAKWFLPTDILLNWVNTELLSKAVQERGEEFSMRSLQVWLHACGFEHGKLGTKGVYFDGHERDDVKKFRKKYIEKQR